MPNISLIQKNGEYKYPATITEAVVDLNKRKKLSSLLDELSDKDFKGKVNQSTDISGLHDYKQGWHWIVNTAGRYVGLDCEVGDMIYCIQDFHALYQISDFEVLQSNTTYITNELIDELLHGYNPGGAIPYYKPEGGIPEEDLSTELLNKINKTDSLATVATTGNYNDLINTPDLSSKANKDSDAVEGNIAIFDNAGNPVDSGKPFPFTYSDLYLTFEALEDGTFNFLPYNNNDIYYSKDGKNWTKGNSVEVLTGDKVMWKGEMTPLEQDHSGGIGTFGSGENANPSVTTISYKAYGNVMSLLYGDNFIGKTELVGNWTFNCLFRKTKITESHNIIIPATTLTSHCYWKMFFQCTQLVSMPTLVATTLASTCYGMMFTECSSLTDNIPSELPVTTLADSCYINMFYNCTSLVVAPKLPATTLTSNCYNAMFFGCSNLEVAPELPAPTLTYNCYWHMFDRCSKLNYIKCLATDKSAGGCCAVWMKNVATSGIFIRANSTTWGVGGAGTSPGVPSGWNIYSESEWEVVRHYELSGYYTKPNGGIPKTDLSSEVQTSLGKADSALQSFTETDPTVPSWAKQTLKPTYTAQEVGALPDTTKYAGSQSVGGAANKAISIPTGQVDSTSTYTTFTATVDGITELRDGICVWLKNGVVNSGANCTLNINNLGAKPMYMSNFANTRVNAQFDKTYTVLFIYNSSRVDGGCWDYFVGYDSNSNDVAWIVRRSGGTYKAKEALNPNQILFTYSDDELLPTSRTRAITPTKELTTLDFDPFGAIYMSNNSKVVAQGANLDNAYIWLQRPLDIRYAFNVGTLTSNKAVYVKCSTLANGRAVLATDTQIYQELPTTEDGYIYIYLGMMQTGNLIQVTLNHPIYYFKDGAIRQWTNQDTTALKLGTSTVGGTTQGIYLNQGVPTACQSYDMWYMKHIAALYGATRNDATGLWSYYYKNCARWDDTNEVIVWDRNIGYDDITDEEMMSMVDNRIMSLYGTYGFGKRLNSRIGFHIRSYGNSQQIQGQFYIGNNIIQTYGYIGDGTSSSGSAYAPVNLNDLTLMNNVRHLIGRNNKTGNQTVTQATKLEYATIILSQNNQKIDIGVCPNIEFVSVYFLVTNGLNYTGCELTLHPDVYAKIFDSTNADYALWHKIDLANQARTNPITILSTQD